MADQDEYFYLQPGFDVSSLTIPRLRSILVEHNVAYPSSAKKQDLLDILQQEVLSRSKKILATQAKVKRTSRGITDVPSSQEEYGEIDQGQMPPPALPKTPRSRKSKSRLRDSDGGAVSTPRTARKSKTPSGRRNTKASDTETDTAQSVRKPRRSTPGDSSSGPTSVKLEEPSTSYSRRSLAAVDSPFSDDNPFQSGSSPPSTSKRLSSTSRSRKSYGDGSRKSISKRREASSPEVKREDVVYTRSMYEVPVSRIGVDPNGVESTEEFTAEAGQELQQDLASDRQLAKKRNSVLVRHKKKQATIAVKVAPFAILTTVLAALGSWYRQEKINIGYCGVGDSSWSLSSNANIPPWIHENFQPQCEICPSHAICRPGMEVQCETDFMLQTHPLSLNGLVPLPPTCEPDSEKERKVKAVADRATEVLRQNRADYECGEDASSERDESSISVVTTTAIDSSKPELAVEVLKQAVAKQRRKGMSDDEFEELWKGAFQDIVERDEIQVVNGESGRVALSSNSLARLPFTCAIQRSLVQGISRARLPISIIAAIVLSAIYGRYRIIAYYQAKAQVPGLVSMTLDRLATQAALKEGGRVQESFISVGQLRDDVLRNVFSAQERERVWQRVRKIVEGNSNVRASTREGGKTGEWSRVWEWIGPVDFAPDLEGRRSGGSLHESPSQPMDGTNPEPRNWNEGHVYY